jgi:poly(3-hydroxybutyrate) depolymerase
MLEFPMKQRLFLSRLMLTGLCALPLLASPLARAAEPVAVAADAEAPPAITQQDTTPRALPALGADLSTLTVSGLSSGAYMAVQMQTAYSSTVTGAAIFAGGPFGCARGDSTIATLSEAMMHCVNVQGAMWNPANSYMGPPSVETRVKDTKAMAKAGSIDPVAGLADDRIYLFSGKADNTVPQGVMVALKDWYKAFVPAEQMQEDFAVDSGHAMVTTDWKNPCDKTELPYINDCDLDGAGKALGTLYGDLSTNAGEGGTLYAITQSAYIPKNSITYTGLIDTAHLFVPESCQPDQGHACRLHVVFHGCQQSQDFIGDQYYTRTGYNSWAAANQIIVLYPQAKPSEKSMLNPMGLPNPNGCWDWWGFTNQDYLNKSGIQMQTVWSMIERLAQKP